LVLEKPSNLGPKLDETEWEWGSSRSRDEAEAEAEKKQEKKQRRSREEAKEKQLGKTAGRWKHAAPGLSRQVKHAAPKQVA